MRTKRIITGARYTQALRRDQSEDFTSALIESNDHAALMVLHAMGYDVSEAKVARVAL